MYYMAEKQLHVGCAMWTHRAWLGRSIPSSTRAGGELGAYARIVNAVEGNTTFYASPSPSTVQRWAEAVDSDFRFMFKLPQAVTHHRKLRDIGTVVTDFLRLLEPLHDNMSPTAIQLPAAFTPDDLPVLDDFLAELTSSLSWAVEVRHPGFFNDAERERALNDVLYRHGANRIILDSRAVFAGPRETAAEHDAFENKPRVPARAVATSAEPVVRFIGQTAADANPPFWQPWVGAVARWVEAGKLPIVFIHTPDNVVAPELARRFHEEVVAATTGVQPLPEAPVVAEQSLFD